MQCVRKETNKHNSGNNNIISYPDSIENAAIITANDVPSHLRTSITNIITPEEFTNELMRLPDKNAISNNSSKELESNSARDKKKVIFADELSHNNNNNNNNSNTRDKTRSRSRSIKSKRNNKRTTSITNKNNKMSSGNNKKRNTRSSREDKLHVAKSKLEEDNVIEDIENGNNMMKIDNLSDANMTCTDQASIALLQSQDLPQHELTNLTSLSTMRRFHIILCKEADMRYVFRNSNEICNNNNNNKKNSMSYKQQDNIIDHEERNTNLERTSEMEMEYESQSNRSLFKVEEYVDHGVLNEQPFDWTFDGLPFDTRFILSVQAFDVNGC